jgi:hypothetical protein
VIIKLRVIRNFIRCRSLMPAQKLPISCFSVLRDFVNRITAIRWARFTKLHEIPQSDTNHAELLDDAVTE